MKKNKYWWTIPLGVNIACTILFAKYWHSEETVLGLTLSDVSFVGSAVIALANIAMFIWWFNKLVSLKTGYYTIITNWGGEYMHTTTGDNDDGFYNNLGSKIFDERWPVGYYIPTTIHSEKRMWGSPGYNSNLPAIPDKPWKDPRNLFERTFGYHFPGFFTKIEPQLIHTHIIKKREMVTEAELKNAKFADATWAVFEEVKEYKKYAPIYDEDIIIVSAKTGAKGAVNDEKLKDELMDINIPIGVQTVASNPFKLTTKTTDIHLVLVDRTDATIRDMVANGTIKDLQEGKHAKYDSDFILKMTGMNGDWQRDKGRYFLSPGLDDGFGFRVTQQCSLKEWSPASAQAEEMLGSTRRITISANKIIEETNLGDAEKQKTIKIYEGKAKGIELVTTAQAVGDQKIRAAARGGGVNPEEEVKWNSISKLRGNVYFGGNNGPAPVTNIDSQTGIADKRKEVADEK